MSDLEKLQRLINQGCALLRTQRPSLSTPPEVDPTAFRLWRDASLNVLDSKLEANRSYRGSFAKHVVRGYVYEVASGIRILRAVREELGGQPEGRRRLGRALSLVAEAERRG